MHRHVFVKLPEHVSRGERSCGVAVHSRGRSFWKDARLKSEPRYPAFMLFVFVFVFVFVFMFVFMFVFLFVFMF